MNIKLIKFGNDDFYKSLKYSLALNEHDNSEIQAVVNSIIKDIKKMVIQHYSLIQKNLIILSLNHYQN